MCSQLQLFVSVLKIRDAWALTKTDSIRISGGDAQEICFFLKAALVT